MLGAESLTKAMANGTTAAWALVAGTFVLGVATILLVISGEDVEVTKDREASSGTRD